jgi:4-hydroxy-L-threonine phosphate dehydrogenase PdxA
LKPLIAVVIGDPSGVGPEVVLKALATGEPQHRGTFVLVGSRSTLDEANRVTGANVVLENVDTYAQARNVTGAVAVLDDGAVRAGDYTVGKASEAGGRATYGWIQNVIAAAERKEIEGLIVAPIDRASFRLAGITGATDEMHPPGTYLLRMTGKLRTMPIGEHVLIRDIPDMVKTPLVLHVIELVGEQLRSWGFSNPRIAVAGLNPHCAGEEDREQIAPAVAAAKARGYDVTGPLSPDTVFRAGLNGTYDVVVTMYHDQGQIAVKTFGLDNACAVFVGLPYVRVGIPHGSAFDIAGKGIAQHGTALTAMKTAAELAGARIPIS